MASVAAATQLFDSLPARPPTPPREANREAKIYAARQVPVDPRLSLQTPPNGHSPVSSAATNSNSSSSRLRKKVEWSIHNQYKEAPGHQYRPSSIKRSSPSSVPPSAPSKPLKGILKPSPSPQAITPSLTGEVDGSTRAANITEMLDSTIKQLAGSDRDLKVDAYMMLARALKASKNLPDRVALQDKMSLFMQFIQRDVTSKSETGGLDTSLINHSLNLLATFLQFPAIASTITTDFSVFIMDHSIRAFQDASAPKDLVRHLMQVVAFQNFAPKVMSPDRVGRLVTALHHIEEHLKGKSIVLCRIQIYRRLVKQARKQMSAYCDWLKDLFTDMLSSIKEIRNQAIALGTEAGFAFRTEPSVMRKAIDALQAVNDDQIYIDFYIQKLHAMFKDRQTMSAVPRIWGTVILFLWCPLEKWTHYGHWLRLIQTSFNSADSQTKTEANHAWNRYVYLSFAESKQTPKSLGTLCEPLLSQLRRRPNAKFPDESLKLRRIVVGGICNLYYYAFRPGVERSSPDLVWDLAVQPVMTQFISMREISEAQDDCLMQASRIMVGLLDAVTPRVWRQDRIISPSLVMPDELPSLDSTWVRRNCDKMFQAAGPILEKRFTDLSDDESQTFRLWQSLVGSVAAASAKDIKVSEETTKFLAYSFSLLHRVWIKDLPCGEISLDKKLFPSVRNFVHTLFHSLGMLPFTERRLSLTVGNIFELVATPSHRSDRAKHGQGIVRTPLHHLFSMLSSLPPGGLDDEAFAEFFVSTFDPFLAGKTDRARKDLGSELMSLLPRDTLCPYAPWMFASQTLLYALNPTENTASGSSEDGEGIGPQYRETVSLLERGITSHPGLPSRHWYALLNALVCRVKAEAGDAGCALLIVEPLAKSLLESTCIADFEPKAISLEATRALFDIAKMPRDRQALDAARRRLWGATPTTSKSGSFDPYENLYVLGNHALSLLYNKLDTSNLEGATSQILDAISSFIGKSVPKGGVRVLAMMEDGLGTWLRDEGAQLQLRDRFLLSQCIQNLWDRICADLAGIGRPDKTTIDQIERLMTAAFRSKHSQIVKRTVEAWNDMFSGGQEDVELPDNLRSAISSAQANSDLMTLTVNSLCKESGARATSLTARPDDVNIDGVSPQCHSGKRQRQGDAHELLRERHPKRMSLRRLRHDNSQIQFTHVAPTSPAEGESQHLTERQKEVRERQRENAAIYNGVSTSPLAGRKHDGADKPELPPSPRQEEKQKATPERTKSYEDIISSTPTPRRGQVLQIEGFNDPPSSPPEPRPYPLLSEIQSRSRESDSMREWDFTASSPTGTPLTSRQRLVAEPELPQLLLTEAESQPKSKSKKGNAAALSPEVVPSSILEDAGNGGVGVAVEDGAVTPQGPSTPPERMRSAPRQDRQTYKSVEDDLTGVRSSHNASSPVEQEATQDGIPSIPPKNASFAFSGDESSMKRFVIELEARRCHLPVTTYESVSPEKGLDVAEECITVQTDDSSPPPPVRRAQLTNPGLVRAAGVVTGVEGLDEVTDSPEASRNNRKRKRSKSHGRAEGSRKRRSEEVEVSQEDGNRLGASVETGVARSPRERPSSLQEVGRTTRSGRMRRKNRDERQTDCQEADEEPYGSRNQIDRKEGGDTEDEVTSQLVAESNAASQNQQTPQRKGSERASPGVGYHGAASGRRLRSSRRREQERDAAATVMEALRGGLVGLREAALSRREVYKIEDMLMDMKRELFEAERRGRGD